MRSDVIAQKLLVYAEKIIRYCNGCTYEEFVEDTMLVEACVFNLSQMGELCRNIEPQFAAAYPKIPWSEMYGLRNRIVHDYEGVNLLLVWEIISEDLPVLCENLKTI